MERLFVMAFLAIGAKIIPVGIFMTTGAILKFNAFKLLKFLSLPGLNGVTSLAVGRFVFAFKGKIYIVVVKLGRWVKSFGGMALGTFFG